MTSQLVSKTKVNFITKLMLKCDTFLKVPSSELNVSNKSVSDDHWARIETILSWLGLVGMSSNGKLV